MENPFVVSVAECMQLAVTSFCLDDLPALIIYDCVNQTIIAEPVARFVRRSAEKPNSNVRVICRINLDFLEFANKVDIEKPAQIVDIA